MTQRSRIVSLALLMLAFGSIPTAEGKSRCPKGARWDSSEEMCTCKKPLVWSESKQDCIPNPCPPEAAFNSRISKCQCREANQVWSEANSACESCPVGQAPDGDACVDRVYPFEMANYWSGELEVIHNARDPRSCAIACERNPDCKVATLADSTAAFPWANTCILRPSATQRHTGQIGMRSWLK
jgi:hypothetical protein